MLSALLLHNELKQNNFSACYHLVAWLKAQKGKQILGLSCWTTIQETHVEMPDISTVCNFWQDRLCTLVIHLLNGNLFKLWSCEDRDHLFLPHSDALNFIHTHSPICSLLATDAKPMGYTRLGVEVSLWWAACLTQSTYKYILSCYSSISVHTQNRISALHSCVTCIFGYRWNVRSAQKAVIFSSQQCFK